MVPELVGREEDVARVTKTWESPGGARVVSIVGPPGIGKSSVGRGAMESIREWPRGASPGQVRKFDSKNYIVNHEYSYIINFDYIFWRMWNHFNVKDHTVESSGGRGFEEWARKYDDWSKGEILGTHLLHVGGLLFLDDLDQRMGEGALEHPGLISLLQTIEGNPEAPYKRCLCLITTQSPLKYLERREGSGSVQRLPIGPLAEDKAIKFLEGIEGHEREKIQVANYFGRHPLTIRLLAGYLNARRGSVEDAYEIPGGDIRAIMTAFHQFSQGSPEWAPVDQLLQLLGLFSGPADLDLLRGLLAHIRESESDSPFALLAGEELNEVAKKTIQVLPEESGYERPGYGDQPRTLYVHPLIQAYEAERIRENMQNDVRFDINEWHKKFGKFLQDRAELIEEDKFPIRRIGLHYEAMKHYCQADDYDEAFKIYQSSIQKPPPLSDQEGGGATMSNERKKIRGATAHYGIVKPDALEPFFRTLEARPAWNSPVRGKNFAQENRVRVVAEAGADLWHSGRLLEALTAFEAVANEHGLVSESGEFSEPQEAVILQSYSAQHAAETSMVLGFMGRATRHANRSIDVINAKIESQQPPLALKVYLSHGLAMSARILHVRYGVEGDYSEEAKLKFEEARKLAPQVFETTYGCWYAEFLLDRAVHQRNWSDLENAEGMVKTILGEAEAKKPKVHLDVAYGHLLLGLVNLYKGHPRAAQKEMEEAVGHMRESHQHPHLVVALLASADCLIDKEINDMQTYREQANHTNGVQSENSQSELKGQISRFLDDAGRIIRHYGMRMYMADHYLISARLDLLENDWDSARKKLGKAEELIERCQYGRRKKRLMQIREMIVRLENLNYEQLKLDSALSTQWDESKRVLRTPQAANLIGVKPETLTRRAMRGKLGEMINGYYVFSVKELREYQDGRLRRNDPKKPTDSNPPSRRRDQD